MTQTAGIIDGKGIARGLRRSVARHAAALKDAHGIVPSLAVVLVGNDAASRIYVANKERAAVKAGIASRIHHLPETATQQELETLVEQLNDDPAVHGILVQMPLPPHLDAAAVLQEIHPAKDVDGLNVENAGLLFSGTPAMVPCTPMGALVLVKSVVQNLAGLHAVVIGRSNLVGKPMAQLLLQENCTVTIAHSHTPQIAHLARTADILVVAAGKAGLVKKDWVKPGAIVIDVGISREDDRIRGDVDFDDVKTVAGHITPVPGGVGPMTIACLLGNTVAAACRQNGVALAELD